MREALEDILANASDCGASQGKTGDAWIAARCKEIAEEALSAPQPAAGSGRLYTSDKNKLTGLIFLAAQEMLSEGCRVNADQEKKIAEGVSHVL